MTADGRPGPDGGRLVDRPTATLRPHPTYQALCGPIAATRGRRVARQRGPIRDPLLTTSDGTILDGHARWQVALDRQQSSLPCLEYDVTDEEALQIVIQQHRASEGLNAFCRIVMGPGAGTLLQGAQPSIATRDGHKDVVVKFDEPRAPGCATGHRARGRRRDRQRDQGQAAPGRRSSGGARAARARGGAHPSRLAVAHTQPEGTARCPLGASAPRGDQRSKTKSELSRVIVDEAAVLVREVLSVWPGEYPVGVDSADDIGRRAPGRDDESTHPVAVDRVSHMVERMKHDDDGRGGLVPVGDIPIDALAVVSSGWATLAAWWNFATLHRASTACTVLSAFESAAATPQTPEEPTAEEWLDRCDANDNGRVTCAEARAEACGAPIPVTKDHARERNTHHHDSQ